MIIYKSKNKLKYLTSGALSYTNSRFCSAKFIKWSEPNKPPLEYGDSEQLLMNRIIASNTKKYTDNLFVIDLKTLQDFSADCGYDDIETMNIESLLHNWKEFNNG